MACLHSCLLQRSRPNGSRSVAFPDDAEGLPGPAACPTSAAARHRIPDSRCGLPNLRHAKPRPREVGKSGAGALVLALIYGERAPLLPLRSCTTWLTELPLHLEQQRAAGSSSMPGSLRLGGGAGTWLMPGARSKRCREIRPWSGVGRLAERERPADLSSSSMQDQVALGESRSPTPVKGGIARAPGSRSRGSADGEGWVQRQSLSRLPCVWLVWHTGTAARQAPTRCSVLAEVGQ